MQHDQKLEKHSQALIPIDSGWYYAAIWFVDQGHHDENGADWLGGLFRPNAQSAWKFNSRFRLYHSQSVDPFDGLDRRDAAFARFPSDMTEERAERICSEKARHAARMIGGELIHLPIHGNGDRAEFLLAMQPWTYKE